MGAGSALGVLQWRGAGGKELCMRSNFFCCLLQQVFVVAVTCAEVGNLRKENKSQMGKTGAEKSPAVQGFAARSERWLAKPL